MKLIDADKSIAEIERQKPRLRRIGGKDVTMTTSEVCKKLDRIIKSIRSLQQEQSKCIYGRTLKEREKYCEFCSAICEARIEKEQQDVNLEKEIVTQWAKCNPIDEGMGSEYANIAVEQFDAIARHFYELGLNAGKK